MSYLSFPGSKSRPMVYVVDVELLGVLIVLPTDYVEDGIDDEVREL